MNNKRAFSGAGALAGVIAAACWSYAAPLPVPDNQDTFIAALQLISEWNSYGASASAVTAICAVAVFVGEWRAK
jgi:hypothetical protein